MSSIFSERAIQKQVVIFMRQLFSAGEHPHNALVMGVEGSDNDPKRLSRIEDAGWLKGWPDLTILPRWRDRYLRKNYRRGQAMHTAPFWIELKTSKNDASPAQTELYEYFWLYEQRVYVVRGFDELIRVLFREGVLEVQEAVRLDQIKIHRLLRRGVKTFDMMGWLNAPVRRSRKKVIENAEIEADDVPEELDYIKLERPWFASGFPDFPEKMPAPKDHYDADFENWFHAQEKLANQRDTLGNYPPQADIAHRYPFLYPEPSDCVLIHPADQPTSAA